MLRERIYDQHETTAPQAVVSFDDDVSGHEVKPTNRLKLLSYNIQVGIPSDSYRHYLTRSWQHVLPHPHRKGNLADIAALLKEYDVVALQEVDGGSIRTDHMNQVEYLAQQAGFDYWYQQLNRNLGKLAQHSNGMLSRYRPTVVEDHKLPGLVPGRGAIALHLGTKECPVVLIMVHLSLSVRARRMQLGYIKELIAGYDNVVIMGDMNTQVANLEKLLPLRADGFQLPEHKLNTYPSWRPVHSYDHILVRENLKVNSLEVLPFNLSDHRPIAMEIELPTGLVLTH